MRSRVLQDQSKARDRSLSRAIGVRLAAKRKDLGITQADLAERLGIEKETVSRIETGSISISLGRLSLFAESLGLSMDMLLRETSTQPADQAATLISALHGLPHESRELVVRTALDLAKILSRAAT